MMLVQAVFSAECSFKLGLRFVLRLAGCSQTCHGVPLALLLDVFPSIPPLDPFRRPPSTDILVENQKRAEAAKDALRDHAARLDLPAGVESRPGDPREVITSFVNSSGADLLVVGSRGLSGATAMLMGSVSSYLVANAGCSVVVYRAPKSSA